MSDGIRDKQFWKLRHLAKQMSGTIAINTLEYAILKREFDSLWCNYGFKSMVMNRRRRYSTRNSNQKGQQAKRRAEKRNEHQIAVRTWMNELTESE
jgi:hypothetical protein